MKQRTLTSLGILSVVTLMFVSRLATTFVFDFVVAVLIILSASEFSKMLSKMNKSNYLTMIGIYPSIGYFFIVYSVFRGLKIEQAILWQVAILAILFVGMYLYSIVFPKKIREEIKLRKEKISMPKFAFKKSLHTLFGMIYPSFGLLFLLMISSLDRFGLAGATNFTANSLSFLVLLIAFLIPMIADTFALLSGMLFQGPKLMPSISPKKTVAGFVGGSVFTVLLLSLLFLILNSSGQYSAAFASVGLSVTHFALLGLLASVACAAGDLFESYLKRKANVKDSGNFLPGHGGFLDRFDSQIFSAPVVFIFFLIILL